MTAARDFRIRVARPADVASVAALHADRISEGFLASLGTGFLRRLYRRVMAGRGGFVLVAVDEPAPPRAAPDAHDTMIGFVAGVADVATLYKQFALRDGVVAGVLAAPRLLRALPRAIETARYPSGGGQDLPVAEILAVAVDTGATGRGVGRALVDAATSDFATRGIRQAKVVTTADNGAALAMYHACAFVTTASVEVHAGRASEVLVWTAS